jgi:hypothetical protein
MLTAAARLLLSILFAATMAAAGIISAQEEPLAEEEHEREELGVNPYTAPSIARIFQQLDELKPLPFEQLKRDFPPPIAASREKKALIFGGLIGDGFLIVEAEKKNLVDELGRILIREARGLGVAERVMRHSAGLTELSRRGDWNAVRQELITTQADVEEAMMELRDQQMAHLISLGGWLRGLEICAGAVEGEFSPSRAKILARPELINYFTEELKTLPPTTAHTALFEEIRGGVNTIRVLLDKAKGQGLQQSDVKTIHDRARKLNLAIRRSD